MAGGFLAISALQRLTPLQLVMRDREQILSAVSTYKSRYDALCGDDARAKKHFAGVVTANGNGNGIVELPGESSESWLFWQHLALASLWPGTFTGNHGPNGPDNVVDAVIGLNVPPGPLGLGYSIHYDPQNPYLGDWGSGHFIVVGQDTSRDNEQTFGAWLAPVEAEQLDEKYDDGIAHSGNVRTHVGTSVHGSYRCTTGTAPNHNYNSANTAARCNLLFMFKP